jgi:hypothetical protein
MPRKEVAAVVDDDIMDEAAGQARIALAEQSTLERAQHKALR